MIEKKPKVIFDIGTHKIKYGLSLDEPSDMLTVVGHRENRISANCNLPDDDVAIIVGDAALNARRRYRLEHPIKDGEIKDSKGFQDIINHIYNENLRIIPDEYSVLIAEPIFADKSHSKALREFFYDHLDVPKLSIIPQPILSLFAFGKSTGLVIEMGEDLTQIAPIYKSELVGHAAAIFAISGNHLTFYLQKLFNDESHMFLDRIGVDKVQQIKEEFCFVASNDETDDVQGIHHEMSDGKHISIGSERTKCPEALFQPSLVGLNSKGLHEVVFESIMKSDETIHEDLFKNIVLSGGSAQFPGLQARLEMELRNLTDFEVNVEIQRNPKFTTWLGGSILAQSSGFEDQMFTRKEWDFMQERHSDSASKLG